MRTQQQNKCLHSYLSQIADQMNDAGIDFKMTVQLPVSFTMENMKEYMFKPIMRGMYPDIDSTSELTTKQLQLVYERFNAAISTRFGVGGDFPNYDNEGKIK